MADEKRLIDANDLISKLQEHHDFFVDGWGGFDKMSFATKCRVDEIDNCIAEIVNAPTVDAYTGEQVDSIIQKADLLEIENRNLEQEVDWLKNCLNCEIRNKCPRHCGKVVHDCDHWEYGDPVVHGHWDDYSSKFDKGMDLRCSVCGNRADKFVGGTEDWYCLWKPNYCPNCGADMRERKDNDCT